MKKIVLNLACLTVLLCFSLKTTAQTAGTLTFTMTEASHTSTYTGTKHTLAVWIESCTPCGTTAGTSTYVRTKMRYWGSGTNDHLPTWKAKSASSTTNATIAATLSTFASRTITWDGTNAAGTTLLADGSYRVAVEECWNHGTSGITVRYFPFTKGPAGDIQTPANDANFTGISLHWTPTLATETFAQGPEAIIYPNPSNGVFTIDMKNQVQNIKVVNLLGQEIYNENIDEVATETSRKVDLSSFTNGTYIITITNDKGVSNYKVLLEK
jgi:uncharacterized protein YaeQ